MHTSVEAVQKGEGEGEGIGMKGILCDGCCYYGGGYVQVLSNSAKKMT